MNFKKLIVQAVFVAGLAFAGKAHAIEIGALPENFRDLIQAKIDQILAQQPVAAPTDACEAKKNEIADLMARLIDEALERLGLESKVNLDPSTLNPFNPFDGINLPTFPGRTERLEKAIEQAAEKLKQEIETACQPAQEPAAPEAPANNGDIENIVEQAPVAAANENAGGCNLNQSAGSLNLWNGLWMLVPMLGLRRKK